MEPHEGKDIGGRKLLFLVCYDHFPVFLFVLIRPHHPQTLA